jgi:hypothetical protein
MKIRFRFTFLILCAVLSARAQTTQIVTLPVGNQIPSTSYALSTNQVVTIVNSVAQSAAYNNGNFTIYIAHSSGVSLVATNGTFTGLTNITVYAGGGGIPYLPGLATISIQTPCATTVISNYVPADAIVIPASATGNVQIILESSSDLVNWTAASPGTYGASSATNRFFRVRAALTP